MAIFDRFRQKEEQQMPAQAQPQVRSLAPEPERTIPQESPVRTGDAERAYNLGARMGAESMVNEKLNRPQEQKQGMTKERLREAEQLLMRYKAGKSSVDRRIISAQQWWKQKNWQQIENRKGTRGSTVYKSSTAWLWNCIVGRHADAIDNFPEPVILPRMEDDKPEAKRLSDIVPVVMQMNDFEETYNDVSWQKLQEGTGVYGVFWNPRKQNGLGDIEIRKVNALNLFFEPGISDIQDSANVFFVSLVDNKLLESQYPQLAGKLNSSAIVTAKYLTDDSIPTDEKSAVIDWYYKSYENGRLILHYCKFVNDEVLYSTEQQGGQGLYDDGMYPFVLDPMYPVEGSPMGYGMIDIGRDAQTDIDTLNQALVQNAVVTATPRFFVRKDGSINEDEFADWSKPFVHCNGNLGQDSILPVNAGQLPGNSINMLQQKIDELKFVTGNTDVNNGGTPAGVTAASAIAALKEDAGRSSKDTTKAAYRAYSKIVTMVIERIRQFYDLPRQFRILGQRGQEEFVSYDNSGLQTQTIPGGLGMEDQFRMPVFDIEVRAQRENAYTKMSQNELALQFYQLGLFNPQMTDMALMTIDMMEFKGKDELQQKIQQNGTMQQTLAQVSQIAMALAQKYDPAVAQQLAMVLQGMSADMGMQAPAGGNTDAHMQSTDAFAKAEDEDQSATVRKAKAQAQQSTRVD